MTRQVISEAVGILRAQNDIPREEAFAMLVTASTLNRPKRCHMPAFRSSAVTARCGYGSWCSYARSGPGPGRRDGWPSRARVLSHRPSRASFGRSWDQ